MNANTQAAQIPTQQQIKELHLKEIFLAALHSGGISRARLKQELHLSFPSVSALVDELIVNGVLTQTDARDTPERGRPRALLQVNTRALAIPVAVMTREGYQCALYDCAANCLEAEFLPFPACEAPVRIPGTRWQPATETLCRPLEQWSRRIRAKHRTADLLLVVPGTVNEAGVLSSSALQMSAPETFLPLLEGKTGWQVIVENNSDCCAYAEKIIRGISEDFIYLYIGKGVGAGIIRNGSIFQGGVTRAGEIGHISIDYNGRTCVCGGCGCLECYISTAAITQDAQAAAGAGLEIEDFPDVCHAYRIGEEHIVQLLQEKALLLTVGIRNMLAMQPVTQVILGGKIALLGDEFLETVRTFFQEKGSRKYASRVTISYTGADSGAEALGAVWNYLDHQMHIGRMFLAQGK